MGHLDLWNASNTILVTFVLVMIINQSSTLAASGQVTRRQDGDLLKPLNKTVTSCIALGGEDHQSLPEYCICENSDSAAGTFMDQCNYNLQQTEKCPLSFLGKSMPYFMKAVTDLSLSVTISADNGATPLARTQCSNLQYEFGKVWNNGEWNSFGNDLFDIRQSGNHFNLVWINSPPSESQWNEHYKGQFFRLSVKCVQPDGNRESKCLLVKIQGTRDYTIGRTTSTTPTTTTGTPPDTSSSNTPSGTTPSGTTPSGTTPSGTTPSEPRTTNVEDENAGGIAAGVVFAILFLILLILLLLCCLHKRNVKDFSIIVDRIPVRKVREYFQDSQDTKSLERAPSAIPNNYATPEKTLHRDVNPASTEKLEKTDSAGNSRKTSTSSIISYARLQLANIGSKLKPNRKVSESGGLDGNPIYEELPETMQRYPPGFNPEVTITGYNDDVHPHPTKFNDIYAIPDRSPAVRRYPDNNHLSTNSQKRNSVISNASSIGWEADEFDRPEDLATEEEKRDRYLEIDEFDGPEDLATEEEKKDRYLEAEENDAFELDEVDNVPEIPVTPVDPPKQRPPLLPKPSDYKHSDLPPVPPPSNINNGSQQPPESKKPRSLTSPPATAPPSILTGNKRPSLTSPTTTAPPSIPTGNKRPSLSSSHQPTPVVPPGNHRPSISSLPRQQPFQDGPGKKSQIPRKVSVQDNKDQNLPQPPFPPSNSGQRGRKSSTPVPPPTNSNSRQGQKSRKHSLPVNLLNPPTIGPPMRQPSFEDYKNNIVPIPEPPSADTETSQDLYLDEADIGGMQSSASLKSQENKEIEEDGKNQDKGDQNNPPAKDYQTLDEVSDFNANQDIYLDLGQVS